MGISLFGVCLRVLQRMDKGSYSNPLLETWRKRHAMKSVARNRVIQAKGNALLPCLWAILICSHHPSPTCARPGTGQPHQYRKQVFTFWDCFNPNLSISLSSAFVLKVVKSALVHYYRQSLFSGSYTPPFQSSYLTRHRKHNGIISYHQS